MIMASNLTDADKEDRFMREAVSRISEALFRVANSADLTGLSLEVDLKGAELTHEGKEKSEKTTGEQEGPGNLILPPPAS